jgi:hypothetical protein
VAERGEVVRLTAPVRRTSPFSSALQLFISTLGRRQVVEKWCRCGGSVASGERLKRRSISSRLDEPRPPAQEDAGIESISVERSPFREEQLLLQPLLVVERRLLWQAGVEQRSESARSPRWYALPWWNGSMKSLASLVCSSLYAS